jgi:hypothetical protein
MHRSVYTRFDLTEVQMSDHLGAYRPPTLREHVDFARFYEEGAPFPANSGQNPTCVAGAPLLKAPIVTKEGTVTGE